MEPATAAIAVKAAEVGAPILGAGISAASQYFTNRWNAKLSRENRSWQERMSNTAHQREMKDLAAAGLNPLLTGKYGGASTPGGSNATMLNPGAGFEQAGHSVSSALMQQRLNKAQIANIDASTQKTLSEKALLDEQIKFDPKKRLQADLDMISQNIDASKALSALQRKQVEEANAKIANLRAEFLKLQTTGKLVNEVGEYLPTPKKILNEIENIKAEFKWLYGTAKQKVNEVIKPKPKKGATGEW